MNSKPNKNVLQLALSGFSWSIIGNVVRSLSGFIVNIFLARLLGPEPFGTVAVALLIIGVGNLVIESGLGSALIQKQEIDEKDISYVFTIQMTFSIGLTIIIILSAPWLALQFSIPQSALVIQSMASMLVLQAFAQVPSALLKRELQFQKLQISQVLSFFMGYIFIGLPLAINGFGVWSLVAAQIIQSTINAIIVYSFSRHPLSLSFRGAHQLTSFGMRVLAANIANWLIQYFDQAIVGKRFGAQSLGFYSRAFFLNSTPASIIFSSTQASLFSAVSRMGNGPETKQTFQAIMSLFAIIFFPVYWLAAMESEAIISLIYGQEWMVSAVFLTAFAIATPFLILMGIQGPILNGLGRPGDETKSQWLTAIFALLVLLTSSTISIVATAWSILAIYIFRFALLSHMTVNALKITWHEIIFPTGIGVTLGVLTIITWKISNDLFFINHVLGDIVFLRTASVLFVWAVIAWAKRNWIKEIIKSLLLLKS